MARPTKNIRQLVIAYKVCSNPEKDKIIDNALTQLKALPNLEVKV